jgi:molybdopterin-guanine dinucleotide biosynthesis protein A
VFIYANDAYIFIAMHISHNEIGYSDVTGVLLAGGKSTRMGSDKINLKVSGQTVFERSLDFLQQLFSRVIIASNRPELALPGIPAIPDIFPGSALGGIFTGLKSAATDWVFVTPCDMPYPDSHIVELLFRLHKGADAVVPLTPGGYEPVFAFYHKNCLPVFEDALKHGRKRIFALYPQLNVRFLEWQNMPADWEKSMLNINTPQDLERVKQDHEFNHRLFRSSPKVARAGRPCSES